MEGPKSILAHVFDLMEQGATPAVAQAIGDHPVLVNQKTFFVGGTLLHYAAANCQVDMVEMLLNLGFDPNAKGAHYGDVPLAAACRNSRLENARLLMEHGSAVESEHSYTSPMFGAILAGSIPIIELLVCSGADPAHRHTLESGQSVNAAEFAALKGQHECAAFLRKIVVTA